MPKIPDEKRKVHFIDNTEKFTMVAKVLRGPYRNFAGTNEGRYDRPGVRYFNILITDPEDVAKLTAKKMPIKPMTKKTPNAPDEYKMHISVKPGYTQYPCVVRTVIENKGKEVITNLDPDDYGILDGADIKEAALTIRYREWDATKPFAVTLEEGRFYLEPLSLWDDLDEEEEDTVDHGIF